MGAHRRSLTPVGVFFGRDGTQEPGRTATDPYFGGVGPERTGRIQCGACMTGCRVGAKNTLVKNYLHLAAAAGAQVRSLATVTAIRPLPGGGYAVDTVRSGSWRPRTPTTTASQVVLAAGTLGTQRLLHRLRDRRVLARVSPRLGELTRTNSESLLGAQTRTVRQDADTHITARQGHGESNPTCIPVGNEATRWIAAKIGGYPGGTVGELANIPMTAHFLGGCVVGDSPDTGVIDLYHRLYGHPCLHVVDGSAVSANLGVNPFLTITAQERAFSLWPNRGEPDARPSFGQPYTRLPPQPPRNPAVPPAAPAALRQPQGGRPHSASEHS